MREETCVGLAFHGSRCTEHELHTTYLYCQHITPPAGLVAFINCSDAPVQTTLRTAWYLQLLIRMENARGGCRFGVEGVISRLLQFVVDAAGDTRPGHLKRRACIY